MNESEYRKGLFRGVMATLGAVAVAAVLSGQAIDRDPQAGNLIYTQSADGLTLYTWSSLPADPTIKPRSFVRIGKSHTP